MTLVNIRLNSRIPCSKSVSGGFLVSEWAMLPISVARPVETTTAVPMPLVTLQPMNTAYFISVSWIADSFSAEAHLATGNDSPVTEAWLTYRSLALINRASPGMMSPAAR